MAATCRVLTRIAACILVIALCLPHRAAAQRRGETVAYEFPAGWVGNTNPANGITSLAPHDLTPGAICVLNLYPPQPANATSDAFHDQIVRNAALQGRLLEPPTHEAIGEFLVTTLRQLVPPGAQAWVRIYTVRWNDRSQVLVFAANNQDLARRFSPVVDAMVRAATLPRVASAPQPSTGAAMAIAGLYSATTMRYDLSGTTVLDQYWYLFSPDGRVCRGYTLPKLPLGANGDLRRFDFAATANADPENCGTFEVHGEEIAMRIGRKYAETVVFRGPDNSGKVTIQRATYSLWRRW